MTCSLRYPFVLLSLVFLSASGCADQATMVRPPLVSSAASHTASERPVGIVGQAPAADSLQTAAAPPAKPKKAPSDKPANEDDIFDPFAKADETGEEEYDPWEPVNTKVFEFNRQVDRFVLKPVAKGYNFVVPDPVQIGVSNMFYNLRFPPRLFNNLFQGKMKGAGIEVGRFLLNSTVGLAGFFDVAKQIDLVTPEEDLGQTLGFYGVGPGPYLVLPLLPPFTVRDAFGYVGDVFLNPINWLVVPIIEVDGVPSVIAHKNRTTTSFIQVGARVFEIVNERSRNLETYQGVEEATLDLYTAVRNAYLQRRALAVRQ